MAKTTIDFDFNIGIGNNVTTPKLFDRRRSFKDIQGMILKLNPDLLKTIISSDVRVEQKMNHGKSSSSENASSTLQPYDHHCTSLNLFPSLPVHTTTSNTLQSYTSPLTIFYNGSVTVFDLPKEKAESVLKFAEEEGAKNLKNHVAESSSSDHKLDEATRYDLSMARSKSLKRFLEKRKDRIASSSPYSIPAQGSLCH